MLSVIYTNDSNVMTWYLNKLSELVERANEQESFIGLDLEYTRDQKDVAVIQLCFKKYVLVFQWARYLTFGALDSFIGYIYIYMMKIA